jgi:hypothetical protein
MRPSTKGRGGNRRYLEDERLSTTQPISGADRQGRINHQKVAAALEPEGDAELGHLELPSPSET